MPITPRSVALALIALAAQGSLAIYVVLIGTYAWYMNKLDIEYGVQEGEDE